jgi:hypothetical protein
LEEESVLTKDPKDPQAKIYKSGDVNTLKIEINKFHPYSDVKYGLWINPNEKVSNRQRHIDFGEKNIQVDIPRPMLNKRLVIRVVWTSFDEYTGDEYNKDFVVVTSYSFICLLICEREVYLISHALNFWSYPKELKVNRILFINEVNFCKGWVLKYDYDTNEALKKIQYPSPDSTGPLSYQHASPVKVLYTLPPYIYLTPSDTLRVAAWDV